jgi:hypothetical protein
MLVSKSLSDEPDWNRNRLTKIIAGHEAHKKPWTKRQFLINILKFYLYNGIFTCNMYGVDFHQTVFKFSV